MTDASSLCRSWYLGPKMWIQCKDDYALCIECFFFGNQKRVAKWLMVIFVPPIMHNYRLCTIKITKYDVLEANDSANDIQVNDPQHGLEANT